MAFNDDSVKAKLSALNESSDSIVSVGQWIMFYRRYADRTAQLWLEKVKESNTSKKLNLIYLANEIMQQAKVRKKDDFIVAFMPIIAEGTALAYKGATPEVQNKIRRVVEVWRQRQVLETGIQDATEARIDDLDKNKTVRSTGGKLGGTLFGASSVPPEFQPLTTAHSALSKAETAAKPAVEQAATQYAEHHNPNTPTPSAPVQAGKLGALMRKLGEAQAAVDDSIKARTQLIEGLEKLMETHRSKLSEDETTKSQLASQWAETQTKRKEVEDIILRRASTEDEAAAQVDGANGTNGHEADGSPEVEGFTPPPPDMEALSPAPAGDQTGEDVPEVDAYAADPIQEQPVKGEEPPPAFEPPPVLETAPSQEQVISTPAPGADLLGSLSLPATRKVSGSTEVSSDPRKRRKMSHKEPDLDEQMFASGEGIGLDEDVAKSLGAQ